MAVSEVARIKQEIEATYTAAKLGLSGSGSGAKHQYITARTERLGVLHNELQKIVGQQAITMLTETLANVPDKVTRKDVCNALRYELSESAETEFLLDWLQDAWKTLDILVARFGSEAAQSLLLAPTS